MIALFANATIGLVMALQAHTVRAPPAGETLTNCAYFPILIQPEYPLSRDALYQKFRDEAIFVRRYFFPLISDFPMYRRLPSAAHDNAGCEAIVRTDSVPAHLSGIVGSVRRPDFEPVVGEARRGRMKAAITL